MESTPTGPEQNAFITLAAPIASIRLVSVGISPAEPIEFPDAFEAVEEAARRLFTIPIPDDIKEFGTSTPTTTESELVPPPAPLTYATRYCIFHSSDQCSLGTIVVFCA